MSKMIERVVRTMLAARYGPVAESIWQEKWESIEQTDPYLPRYARAAIAAMREPTEEMLNAGCGCLPGVPEATKAVVASNVWHAMHAKLDAVLAETVGVGKVPNEPRTDALASKPLGARYNAPRH